MQILIRGIRMDLKDLVLERMDLALAMEMGMPSEDVEVGWWLFNDARYGVSMGILGPADFEGIMVQGPLVPGRTILSEADAYYYAMRNHRSVYEHGVEVGDPVIFPYWLGDPVQGEVPVPTLGLVTEVAGEWATVRAPEGGNLDFKIAELFHPNVEARR